MSESKAQRERTKQEKKEQRAKEKKERKQQKILEKKAKQAQKLLERLARKAEAQVKRDKIERRKKLMKCVGFTPRVRKEWRKIRGFDKIVEH